MRLHSLIMPILVLLTTFAGTFSYALDTDEAAALDLKVRAAAGRALVNADSDIRESIRHIQTVGSPRPIYELLQLKNSHAQSAILDEMILPDLMRLLSYDTDRINTSAGNARGHIDSNFSGSVQSQIVSVGKSYGFLFDRVQSESEWLAVSLRANYSLQVVNYLATRLILKWVPYTGDPNSWDAAVHELARDPEMAEAITMAYENSKNQILAKMNESAKRLKVTAPIRALVKIHRPVSYVAFRTCGRFL